MQRLVPLAWVISALWTSPLAAAQPDARSVIAASKLASGGAAWDELTGSYERGEHNGSPYETWLDFRRYGMVIRAAGVTNGFDGKAAWRRDRAGRVEVRHDPAAATEAVTTAYMSTNGYFFPERFKAKTSYVRDVAEDASRFDVLRVEPVGGRPLELWFDTHTHLVARILGRSGPQAITVRLSDYRPVGKVLIPFNVTVVGADGRVLDEGRVSHVEHRFIDRGTFAPAEGRPVDQAG